LKKKPDKSISIPDFPKISPPSADAIQKAGRIIQQGGVVCFPTSGLYGLGANAVSIPAIQRIYHIKQRADANPVLILIHDINDLNWLVTHIPESAKRLIQAFWPGHVTLIMTAASSIPALLTAHTGKIGIRLPLHPVARELVRITQIPITGTSANISGYPGCATIAELDPRIIESVDMILNAGTLRGGQGSTVVDVTENPIQIIREGSVPAKDILDCIRG
jgi:L-threonylcarbamoyladenylate synthase